MEAGIYTVSELRIGNLLGFYKPEISEMQVGRVNEIYVDDEKTYRIILNEYSHNIGLTTVGVKPIQLTEERLVKFGFVKVGEYYDKAFNGGVLRIDEAQIMIFEGSEYALNIAMDYDCIILPIEVKHIHQLQNLYFALTGEELIPK